MTTYSSGRSGRCHQLWSLRAPVTGAKPFPESSLCQKCCAKSSCALRCLQRNAAHPSCTHHPPTVIQGIKTNIDRGQSPPVLTHTKERGKMGSMRWSRSLCTSVCAQTQIFPAGPGFCSVTELRRVSSGLAHAFTKLPMNLKLRQGSLKLGMDG